MATTIIRWSSIRPQLLGRKAAFLQSNNECLGRRNRNEILCSMRRYLSTTSLLSKTVLNHLLEIKKRYNEISDRLGGSEALSPTELAVLGKEFSEIGKIVLLSDERKDLVKAIDDLLAVESEELKRGSEGEEMAEMCKVERLELLEQLKELEGRVIDTLTPRDAADDRGVVLEVRAGTGGDEASLFASEVFKMYNKFALLKGWKWEEMSYSKTEIGGFKEAQAVINGDQVFRSLKFESGVHRVQRVPVNDVKIQTSAASVIVLPEAEEIDVEIRQQDLRIDVYRAGGAGGQSVNKTESAVRITHIPTGLQVAMQDERSQIQNRARAMKYLRARLYDHERRKHMQSRSELRSAAQGTGDRSDKVRTYNFPQDRVTDHRVNVTIQGVQRVMSGEAIDEIIDALITDDDKSSLVNFLESLEKRM